MKKIVLWGCFCLIGLLVSASVGNSLTESSYYAWDVLGESYPRVASVLTEATLPEYAWPIAGIVSHHLLAGELIDQWFQRLAQRRPVDTFIIISPKHWDLGTKAFSMADTTWQTLHGLVPTNQAVLRHIANTLEAEIDSEVFVREHGVDTFMPFIARYFPQAKVTALVYRGESPVDSRMADTLWQGLRQQLSGKAQEKTFLLISADFAHHGDIAGTLKKDQRTRLFLDEPSSSNWIFAGCDNRPGMYVLGHLAEMLERPIATVLYHSNSFALSGFDQNDITSYFFTFLSETLAGD